MLKLPKTVPARSQLALLGLAWMLAAGCGEDSDKAVATSGRTDAGADAALGDSGASRSTSTRSAGGSAALDGKQAAAAAKDEDAGAATGGAADDAKQEDTERAQAGAVSKAFDKLAEVYCDKLAKCSAFGFGRSYQDADDCRARRTLLYGFWSKLPDSGWTAEAVLECSSAVDTLSCREFVDDNTVAACMPKGNRKVGESCNAREQCESRFCSSQGYACGTCREAPAQGASCTLDGDCPDNSACLCDNGTPRCSEPRCLRLRDAEEACSPQQPCGAGLNCVDSRCQPAPSVAGDACDPFQGVMCDTVSAGLVCTESGCAKLLPAAVCSPTEYCQDRRTSCEISADSATAECVPTPDDAGGACDVRTGRMCRFPALCVAGQCQLPGAASLCEVAKKP